MIRRLFTLASVVSLLLCLALTALWIRSYFASDWYTRVQRTGEWERKGSVWVVYTWRGGVSARVTRVDSGRLSDQSRVRNSVASFLAYKEEMQDFQSVHMEIFGDIDRPATAGWRSRHALEPFERTRWGFYFENSGFSSVNRRAVAFPFWALVTALGLLPGAWGVGWARMHLRRRRGFCVMCHYNLTGNTSGICPECGTAVAGKVGT